MDLKPVHPDEVKTIISNLKITSAFGLDEIDTFIVKLLQEEITPAVTHIINLSITTGTFPNKWKVSKVVPLHKKDDILNPENYRPVSIIPVMSKILERVVFSQVLRYLKDNDLLNPNHHAYRDKHSTTTAMLQMLDGWLQAVETGQMAGVCMLDMSAAFDVVDHDILIEKMAVYGFSLHSIHWFESYPTGRRQGVSINVVLSTLLPVNSGLPQGSILGPLLYTLFTNELPEVISEQNDHPENSKIRKITEKIHPICCYADDTTMTDIASNHSPLSQKLTNDFEKISKFIMMNSLKLINNKRQKRAKT